MRVGAPALAPSAAAVGIRSRSAFVPELESVRGIAILLVFAFHVDSYVRFPFAVQPTTPLALAFVRAGHTGVDLFFVLSAFLLSRPFLVDAAGGRRVVLRDYFGRRALRILPLYYTAVVVGTMASAEHLRDLGHALPYLAFLNGFGLQTDMNPYSSLWWSLATEAQFYLLLPLLAIFLRTRRGRWAGVAFLVVYAAAYTAVIRGDLRMPSIGSQMYLLESVFGRGPLFLWGILAAAVHLHFGDRIRASLLGHAWLRRGGADAAVLLLLLVNAVFLQWVVSLGTLRLHSATLYWHIPNGALWAAFVLCLLLAPLRTKRVFSNPVLGWLGILSYSIYIIHSPFMQKALLVIRRSWPRSSAGWTLKTALVITLLTVACVSFSALTYRFIERPFLVRKSRLGT